MSTSIEKKEDIAVRSQKIGRGPTRRGVVNLVRPEGAAISNALLRSGQSSPAFWRRAVYFDDNCTSSSNPMDETPTQDDLLEIIRLDVWSGFYNAEDLLEYSVGGWIQEGVIDEFWATEVIEKEFKKKLAAEKSWPKKTDCDRLDTVFDELNDSGIIALQNAGIDLDDGLEDVEIEFEERGGHDANIRGHCFYHRQDLHCTIDGGGLYLAFGDVDGDDEKAIEIGHEIVAKCREHGFEIEWEGTIQTRILVKMKWQRRLHQS